MSFTAKIQRTIHAPVSKVWDALTKPELLKQYFFGTHLITTWEVGTPVLFEGEWDGQAYQDKGTVLQYEDRKMLQYDYFSAFSGLEDRPENYQSITYQVAEKGGGTELTILQHNIDTEDRKEHSIKNWEMLMDAMQQMLEGEK